jgi:all-trans-retinol dehydrogenase (NAD+)
MTDFLGKNVLITGAGSGIGRLMAEKIAAEGGQVALWDVNREGLDRLREELEGRGAKARTYLCDVTNRSAVSATAEQVLREQGPVDILINNAGVVTGKLLLEASDQEIQRTIDVNLMALFWVTRAFLPKMVERNRGHVVTIASAAGMAGVGRLSDYCASKFAAVGFDESLRLELKRQNLAIRTTGVCPYYISTGMFEGVKTRFPWLLPILKPEKVVDRTLAAIRKNRRRLLMPWFVYTIWPTRLLPVPLFAAIMDFFGANRSMDEFTGRSGH